MAMAAGVFSLLDNLSPSQRQEREKNLEKLRQAALERTKQLADAVERDEAIGHEDRHFLQQNTTSHEYCGLISRAAARACLRREAFKKYVAGLRLRSFEARRDKVKVLR